MSDDFAKRTLEATQEPFRRMLALLNNTPDMSEIRGMPDVVDAMVDAILHRKNILLIGPPGIGKTMLARRIPTIMPQLSEEQGRMVAEVMRGMGMPEGKRLDLVVEPPFRAPHHSVSAGGLVGDGSVGSYGELGLARGGVLFLDEIHEFRKDAIHQLRCHKDFECTMVVASTIPCPCGWFEQLARQCSCTEHAVNRHLLFIQDMCKELKISRDVIVPHMTLEREIEWEPCESSESIRARILVEMEE